MLVCGGIKNVIYEKLCIYNGTMHTYVYMYMYVLYDVRARACMRATPRTELDEARRTDDLRDCDINRFDVCGFERNSVLSIYKLIECQITVKLLAMTK